MQFEKDSVPVEIIDDGIDISESDEQFSNECSQILSTNVGIEIWFNDVHPLNVEFSIDLIDDGIDISFNVIHCENEYSSIIVTEYGIVINVIFKILIEIELFKIFDCFWKN